MTKFEGAYATENFTLREAVDFLESLLDQCNDPSIAAPDLIMQEERAKTAETLMCVLNICDGLLR